MEMRLYFGRKKSMAWWSVAFATAGGAILALKSPLGGVALALGTVCGLVNALLTMRGNERLLDHRSVAAFVISSILRIFVFAIVPVEFALHAPWWTMAAYFIGFFLPLALYWLFVARDFRTS
jgi:hypothetical protein